MLRLVDVCKSFKFGKNKVLILDKINICFRKNELVFILGSSGSGKSTLLNIIGGLLEVDSGKILLDDKDITRFNSKMLCNYRNNMIGNIFQNYHLIEYMSVIDNIKLGQTIFNNNNNSVEDILKKLGIYNKRNVKVNKLSGGEKQRVAIARAIINNPDIILCDEPTGALDSANSIKIMEILKELSKDKLVIVVSHDEILANKYADRIIKIVDGKIDSSNNIISNNDSFKKIVKKKISNFSIFKLAFKNLCLKKGRTLFTSFAISLGFICMMLVLCLSRSFNNDIDKLESNIVSMFPISIYNGKFENMDKEVIKSNEKIIAFSEDDYMYENKINKKYLDYVNQIDRVSYISYNYDISMPVISDCYKKIDNKYLKMLSDNKLISKNYDILYGRGIESIYDILLKVDSNNNVSSMLDVFNLSGDLEYSELIGRKFRVIINNDYYVKNGNYYYINTDNKGMYDNSYIELKIVGIVREKEIVDDNSYFYYDNGLIDYIMDTNSRSSIVIDQLNSDYNVLLLDSPTDNLLSYLGYNSLPNMINIYVDSVKDKDMVIDKLNEYNKVNDKLIYIDTVKDTINIVKNFIKIVTAILVIFSFISMIVSSLMIFILTNNRVIERIKEIGILKSLGARSSDVRKLFNLENFIIGIISTCIGIIVVYLLVNPINYILGILIDSSDMFMIYNDLVIYSLIFNMFIVVLSGYIPSMIAGKKKIINCINWVS